MRPTPSVRRLLLSLALLGAATAAGAQAVTKDAPETTAQDPRVGLGAGLSDAKSAARGMELVSHSDRPAGWFDPQDPGSFGFANADLAFSGNLLFQGGFNGVQIWDITNPASPSLRASIPCPGGQGDVSVFRNLLFMSVEEYRGRVNCGAQEITDSVSAERFRGVRVFDITDVARPRQIAAVQTCRGSHTHTLLVSPSDPANVYVYVQGTGPSRPAAELAGCVGNAELTDPNNPYFRIEVIKVPLSAPQDARIVSMPRIFANAQGSIAGLNPGGSQGEGAQQAAQTNQCHDITTYPALGLAAGACAGNGILLDISDPANPRRIAEVSDPNFAYWHSATFNNDGSKVLFSDEWGGGTQPRCRATDRPTWGADAIFSLENGRLTQRGYYKLPAPQTATDSCVAHTGSLGPIPGGVVMVQAWYQGGVSMFDWTDPAHPVEIAFFDRGPMSATELQLGGFWSAYWYNGRVYGSEIGRGLDVFRLTPSASLSANEIAAAELVRDSVFNPQMQTRIEWPASAVVSRAYLDQLARNDGLAAASRSAVARELDRADRLSGAARRTAFTALAQRVEADAARAGDPTRVRALAASLRKLADAAR
ncbi:MAG: LVIVD repeat-containing protein [Gaiellaceae bacterium]